jgi:hypothetical protein
MSNETKRDVFEAVINSRWRFLSGNTKGEPTDDECMMAYDTAMPDDLPVIPKSVGDVIVKLKHKRFSLSGAMCYAAVVSLTSWMTFEHEEDFANAWLLGVWRVEETGEIVKLETEK